jgi:hypothetical protein
MEILEMCSKVLEASKTLIARSSVKSSISYEPLAEIIDNTEIITRNLYTYVALFQNDKTFDAHGFDLGLYYSGEYQGGLENQYEEFTTLIDSGQLGDELQEIAVQYRSLLSTFISGLVEFGKNIKKEQEDSNSIIIGNQLLATSNTLQEVISKFKKDRSDLADEYKVSQVLEHTEKIFLKIQQDFEIAGEKEKKKDNKDNDLVKLLPEKIDNVHSELSEDYMSYHEQAKIVDNLRDKKILSSFEDLIFNVNGLVDSAMYFLEKEKRI